jgi:hypothetical protein
MRRIGSMEVGRHSAEAVAESLYTYSLKGRGRNKDWEECREWKLWSRCKVRETNKRRKGYTSIS